MFAAPQVGAGVGGFGPKDVPVLLAQAEAAIQELLRGGPEAGRASLALNGLRLERAGWPVGVALAAPGCCPPGPQPPPTGHVRPRRKLGRMVGSGKALAVAWRPRVGGPQGGGRPIASTAAACLPSRGPAAHAAPGTGLGAWRLARPIGAAHPVACVLCGRASPPDARASGAAGREGAGSGPGRRRSCFPAPAPPPGPALPMGLPDPWEAAPGQPSSFRLWWSPFRGA